jgi:hypothetical protein
VLVERVPVLVGVLLGVVVAAIGAFALSLPMLRSPIDRTMLGTSEPRVGVAQVRRVFREYGVQLHYLSHPSRRLTMLGVTPPPYPATALTVSVSADGRLTARYGGRNERVRRRVDAAIAALRR